MKWLDYNDLVPGDLYTMISDTEQSSTNPAAVLLWEDEKRRIRALKPTLASGCRYFTVISNVRIKYGNMPFEFEQDIDRRGTLYYTCSRSTGKLINNVRYVPSDFVVLL